MAGRHLVHAPGLAYSRCLPDPDRVLPACLPARLLEAQIAHFEVEWTQVEGGLERFGKMLAMAERESRAALACARSLRLTPQAQMHPLGAGRRIVEGEPRLMPWEGYGLPRSPLERTEL
jgi:hypothetical protein